MTLMCRAGMRKHMCVEGEHSLKDSSVDWMFGLPYRRIVSVNDQSITQHSGLIEVNMLTWEDIPTGTIWTNSVRVCKLNRDENQTEISSQTIPTGFDGTNSDQQGSVCFFLNDTNDYDRYVVYYGDRDIGHPGYEDNLHLNWEGSNIGITGRYYTGHVSWYQGNSLRNFYTKNGNKVGSTYFYGSALEFQGAGYIYNTPSDATPAGLAIQLTGCIVSSIYSVKWAYDGTDRFEITAGPSPVYISFNTKWIFTDSQMFKQEQKFKLDGGRYRAYIENYQTMEWRLDSSLLPRMSYCMGSSTGIGDTVGYTAFGNSEWPTKRYICCYNHNNNEGVAIHNLNNTEQILIPYSKTIIFNNGEITYKPRTAGGFGRLTGACVMDCWVQFDDNFVDATSIYEHVAWDKSRQIRSLEGEENTLTQSPGDKKVV